MKTTGLAFSFLALSLTTQAITFDPTVGFSTNANPNGFWTYGWDDTNGVFHAHTNVDASGVLKRWFTDLGAGEPAATYNSADTNVVVGTQTFQPHQFALHPGTNGEAAFIRWTAPVAGRYSVSATWQIVDSLANTYPALHVFSFPPRLNANNSSWSWPPIGFDLFMLSEGDSLFFGVGGGVGTNNQVGLNLQIIWLDAKTILRVSQYDVCWPTETNKTYQAQYRSDVAVGGWSNVGPSVVGTGSIACQSDSFSLGTPQRFYRVVELP